jgi:hypothetical protein
LSREKHLSTKQLHVVDSLRGHTLEEEKGDMCGASDLLLMRVRGAISVKVLQQVKEDGSIFGFFLV